MNLTFEFVRTVERDGLPYRLERADITKCGAFWGMWRSPAADAIKKLLYIQPEGPSWYAYRLKLDKPDGDISYAPFDLTYVVKDVSKLLPYQPVAVSHLVQSIIDNGAAADGSDTGIGKTYQALAVCRELTLRPCVICRKAGVAGWRRGCAYMGVNPYCIVNWEAARTGKVKVGERFIVTRKHREYRQGYDYTWNVPKGVLLIFDEAHLGFNLDSQNYAMWTASRGRASLSLSATFADRPSRLRGLFSVLRVMDEEKFDGWLLEKGHFVNQYNDLESLTAIDDMKAINKILYPKYGYRVSYEDEEVRKFFPDRVIQTEIVDLGDKSAREQNEAYKAMIAKAEYLRELGKQAEVLVADLRYRQYAELLKVNVLAELAKEYMYEGKYVCVFVNFRETLRYLAEILDTKSLIFGNQEQYGLPRERVIEDFQNGLSRVILCMIDAGGQSLDLHDVNGHGQRISLICPTYDPVKLQQVLGRTLRAGSKTTPIMKLVYAANTVEEKVAETVNGKLDNIAALNDGDLMEPDLFSLGAHNT
jgi:superfamily II DNA or RNA helicase